MIRLTNILAFWRQAGFLVFHNFQEPSDGPKGCVGKASPSMELLSVELVTRLLQDGWNAIANQLTCQGQVIGTKVPSPFLQKISLPYISTGKFSSMCLPFLIP